jgi:hypothetical protein
MAHKYRVDTLGGDVCVFSSLKKTCKSTYLSINTVINCTEYLLESILQVY